MRLLLVYLEMVLYFKIGFFSSYRAEETKKGGNLIGGMDVGWKSNEMKCRRLSVGMPPGIRGCKLVQGIREEQNGQLSEQSSLKLEIVFLKDEIDRYV